MLAILLFILKLIGIIALILLGVILFVVVLVFLAPVKYKSDGYKREDAIDVSVFITYMNPIVRIKIHYPDDVIVQVKVCGFTVYPAKEKKTKDDTPQEEISYETPQIKTVKKESEPAPSGEAAVQGQKTEKRSIETERAKDDTIDDAKESTKESVLDTVGYYGSLLSENKALILKVLKTILKAFQSVLPQKCRIQSVFGTGQADTTGFIYAAYCGLRDSLPGEIYLEPVWTEKHIEGEYYLQGKIRLIHFLVAVIKVIANKEVRLLIKKLRRM